MICGINFDGPLTAAEARARGRGSWVYVIYDGAGPRYVGQSTNLETRIVGHSQYGPGMTIFVADVTREERLAIEARLITELRPRFNKPAGRPRKLPGERLSSGLNIKMTQADKALIELASGGEPTAWARRELIREAQQLTEGQTDDA